MIGRLKNKQPIVLSVHREKYKTKILALMEDVLFWDVIIISRNVNGIISPIKDSQI